MVRTADCRSPCACFKLGCTLMLLCGTYIHSCVHTTLCAGVRDHGFAQFTSEHIAQWLELQTADHQLLASNLGVPSCCRAGHTLMCPHTLCTGDRDHGFVQFTGKHIAQWLELQTADHHVPALNLGAPSCCCAGHTYSHVSTRHCVLVFAIMALLSSQVII